MNTQKFLQILGAHPEKELVFEYEQGRTVGAHYHITEIKNVTVDAVDCGGRSDRWKETVIQLWDSPTETGEAKYITANKALEILNRVNGIKPLDTGAPVRIEYGNPGFHTAQLPVEKITDAGEYLVVHLHNQPTSCKASELCGVEASPTREDAACSAQSGCCS